MLIDSSAAGTIDVSQDIASGQVQLRENGLHTMQIGLLNKRRKYDRAFSPNDRFVIYMKRITELLVMTGYLNAVPYVTAWERTISLTGSCSNKRLLYHYWDPGSQAAFQLLSATGNLGDQNTANDGGIGSKVLAILEKVAGLDPNHIHLGQIPGDWMRKIVSLYNATESQVGYFFSGLGGQNSNGSTNFNQSVGTTYRSDAPNGAGLPTTFAAVTANAPLFPNDIQPLRSDGLWIGLQWGYRTPPDGNFSSGVYAPIPLGYLKDRRVVITNPNNNKGAVLSPCGWGPGPRAASANNPAPTACISSFVMEALGLHEGDDVMVAWVKPDQESNYGPQLLVTAPTNADPGVQTARTNSYQPQTNPNAVSVVSTAGQKAASAAYQECTRNPAIWYQWGGTDPNSGLDCSGLVQYAWKQAGVTIPRTSEDQYAAMHDPSISADNLQPGDLIFYEGVPPAHVTMYVGLGSMAEAAHTGTTLHVVPVYPGYVGFGRPKGVDALGTQVTGSGAGAAAAGGDVTNQQLITEWDWFGQGPDPLSMILSGERALMNDQPLLPFIDMLIKTSMRSWCAAPNGDFISWFPDYFGVYGTAGVMDIANIELQDFTIMWADDHLITHQFTAGTYVPTILGPSPGGPTSAANIADTMGIATVEVPQILQALFNLSPTESGGDLVAKLLNRFGARPNFTPMQTILGHIAEFWYALYLFQMNWASQFSARVPITFMPEMYPGMLMRLPQYGFQAYVTGVTHSFNLSQGGGFKTDVDVIAPSATTGSGLYGLPQGGLGGLV